MTARQRAPRKTNGKAAAPVAAAARSEVIEGAKTHTYRDLELDLPAVLPAIILFDLTEAEASNDGNPMPIYRLLRTVLGQDQFIEVRNRVPATDDGSEVVDLLNDILGLYGVSMGESEASPSSLPSGGAS